MIDWTKWKLVPVEATPEMCRSEELRMEIEK